MGEHDARGRKNDDGSVDVWEGRRRLHFPGGGRKPTVTTDDPPPPDVGALPSRVLVDVGDPVTMVSYDGWYARLTAAAVDINRTQARRRPGRIYYDTFGGDGS